MAEIVKVGRWGNSLGFRIPQPVVDELGLRDGSPVKMLIADGVLIVTKDRPRYRLDDLLAKMPASPS